jgi:hypothetical protein
MLSLLDWLWAVPDHRLVPLFDPKKLGKTVPRGFPRVLAGESTATRKERILPPPERSELLNYFLACFLPVFRRVLQEYSRDGLPDWDYAVTVTRSTQPERYEIYTATLQKPLPRFRLPLASDDRDTVLDLRTAFTRCYDQGGFASKLDYGCDPTTPLNSEDRQWLQEVLKQQKLR